MSSGDSPISKTGLEPLTASQRVANTGDLVREIISHLHNKNGVLAACMRVSPLFNDLASIPLYSDITVWSVAMRCKQNPFAVSEEHAIGSIASKNELLRLAKTVTITEHRCETCSGVSKSTPPRFRMHISAETLRVHLSIWRNDLAISQKALRFFDSVSKLGEAESCPIIRNFTGPNLVLFGANMQRALLKTHSIPASVKNLTIVVNQDTLRDPIFEHYPVNLSLERLDFLFYNTKYLAVPKIFGGHLGTSIGGGHVGTSYSNIDKSKLANLAHVILHAEAAAQIRVIDMDESSQKTFSEKILELNQRHGTRLSGKEIVFLTQNEYRDQREWKGVLTPAEVRMWKTDKQVVKQ